MPLLCRYICATNPEPTMIVVSRLLGALVVASLALLLPIGGARAQLQDNRVVPASPGDLRLSYAPIVKRVAPAVVNVYAAKVVENRNPLFEDPIFRRFFGGGARDQVQRSLGSGVIVDAAGLVVTNNHVIEGADQVKVSLAAKRQIEAGRGFTAKLDSSAVL